MAQPQGSFEAIGLCSLPPSRNSEEGHNQATLELGKHPQLAEKRSWLKTVLFQTACALWILPVAVLLTLNIKKHIVGASAWCPDKDCYVGWYNPVRSIPLANLRDFDRRDHNLLGALQFAAKALEIWFELIALALVYLITFLIAGKRDGLPIGFLTRPTEFSDLPGMFDPLLWKTLPRMFGAKKGSGGMRFRLRIYLFVGFTVLLCILCNLMGPATAVLALPSLQWIDTPLLGNRIFQDLKAGQPPTKMSADVFDSVTTNCSEEHLRNLQFSCAANFQASQLDSWIESFLASGIFENGQTQEGGVKFSLNQTFGVTNGTNISTQTATNIINWVPNRQVLSELNGDLAVMSAMSLDLGADDLGDVEGLNWSDDPNSYSLYNRSLQVAVQRVGPVIGSIMNGHHDRDDSDTWTTIIDDSREIRWYANYQLEYPPFDTYTKCVRVGSGWGSENKRANFTVQGSKNYTTNTSTPDVEVNIFTSDRAQFFKDGNFPEWLPSACFEEGQLPMSTDCEWDRLFLVKSDTELFNRTRNVTTIEMQVRSNDTGLNTTSYKYSFDFVAFLNFTTYQLDPSPLTNPQILVQTHDLPRSGTNVHVDPAWMLAAWTVDNNGLLNPDRTAAIELSRVMDGLFQLTELDYRPRAYISMLPILQTLSLIDFTTEEAALGVTSETAESDHPLLTWNAKMYVWAYGLESRTSKLGLVVALLGIAVVLVQLVLGCVDRRKYRSGTQLLVAALEHVPAKEFEDYEHDEAKVARMRFHVQGTSSNAGKYVFRKMAGH